MDITSNETNRKVKGNLDNRNKIPEDIDQVKPITYHLSYQEKLTYLNQMKKNQCKKRKKEN